ncbi:MAG: anti-sigma B factor antagonist [Candidatus Accumulibacter sp.]|nr:anti-sigma B factor antagonist [Accumulibacter sp.]
MSLRIRMEEGRCIASIEGELSIYTAYDLKRELLALLDRHQHLELDLSAVGELDTAGCQILVLLRREAGKQSKELTFSGRSDPTVALIELLGLVGYFSDDTAPRVVPGAELARAQA